MSKEKYVKQELDKLRSLVIYLQALILHYDNQYAKEDLIDTKKKIKHLEKFDII